MARSASRGKRGFIWLPRTEVLTWTVLINSVDVKVDILESDFIKAVCPEIGSFKIVLINSDEKYSEKFEKGQTVLLKMDYVDGVTEYSKVIYVESDCVGQKTKVYPNPFNTSVNISSDDDIQAVELYSLSGAKLMDVNISDNNNIYIDIKDKEASTIMLKITYKGGITKILKLVKYL